MASDRPSEDYQHEINRVHSFNGWPLNETHKPKQLAGVGFVFTGEGTLVRCFSCGIKYRDWKKGDNPFTIHKTCNPRCPFLQTLTCKQKVSNQELLPLLKPLNYNSHSRPSYRATSTNYDNTDNSSALENRPCAPKRKSHVGWALNKVVYQEQNEINKSVKVEEKKFFGDRFYTSRQSQDPQSTSPWYQQSVTSYLTANSDLMVLPDSSLPQQCCEKPELDERGGIDPYEYDSTSELDPDDADQPHTQQVGIEKQISTLPELPMHKKTLSELSIDDILKSCNVDFSNLWMEGYNQFVQMQESKNSSVVSSSVSLSSDESDKGTIPLVNGGSNPADNVNYVDITCTICRDRRKDSILLPCGHTYCEPCAKRLKATSEPCPLCRKAIEAVHEVYI